MAAKGGSWKSGKFTPASGRASTSSGGSLSNNDNNQLSANSLISGTGPDNFRVSLPQDFTSQVNSGQYGETARSFLERFSERRLLTQSEANSISARYANAANLIRNSGITENVSSLPASAQRLRSGPRINSQQDFNRVWTQAFNATSSQGQAQIADIRASLGTRVSRANFDRFLSNRVSNGLTQASSGRAPNSRLSSDERAANSWFSRGNLRTLVFN